MGKSQEGKQERNRRKQRGNAEEDRNLKRDRDLEKEKVESLYVTREMAEDKEMDEKIRQDLIHVADQAEKEFQEEEALGAPRMKPEEKQQLFDDIVGELKKKGIWEESPEDQLSAEGKLCALAANSSTTPRRNGLPLFIRYLKVWLELLLWRWGCLC